MSNIDPKVLAKLKKLLALEEGAKKIDSLHEAEVASIKIQELLLANNIVRDDINGINEEKRFEMREIKVKDFITKVEGKWLVKLYAGLAKYNLCDFINLGNPGNRIEDTICIIGKPTNLDIIEFLGAQLVERLKSIEKQNWEIYYGTTKRNAYKRAFLFGAAMGIRDKLRIEWEKAQNFSVQMNALIVSNKAALEQFMQKQFPNSTTAKNSSLSGHDAMLTGYQVGKGLSIHKGINGDTGKGLKLINQ